LRFDCGNQLRGDPLVDGDDGGCERITLSDSRYDYHLLFYGEVLFRVYQSASLLLLLLWLLLCTIDVGVEKVN
jgi:hypothetical protein